MNNQTRRLLVAIALLIGLFYFPAPVQAAAITVTSLADTKAVDGFCTLREAIQNAQTNAATNVDCPAGNGTDTIGFALSGVITLGSSLPAISDPAGLTIDGAGQTVTINGANLYHILSLGNGTLTLMDLGFNNGSSATSAGAIDNQYGTLTITNCIFSANQAAQYNGGAIYNESGVVIISNSIFSDNSAPFGYHGGGAIYSLAGNVSISNSTFDENSASRGGGIYCYDCTLNIASSTFSTNGSGNGSGGAIHSQYGEVTITDSIFAGNGSPWGDGGGAIYSEGGIGSLEVASSIFSGNSASGSPGGAIYNEAPMQIRLSTFSSNSADLGGAIYTEGAASVIANSTFSGNNAGAAGVSGGGLLNSGTLIITNSTFSGNSAAGSGGGVGRTGGTLTLRNTLLADNSGGNCAGTIVNGGANLEDGVTCGWGSTSGSQSGVDPLLGALIGSPAYFPLQPGSPAVDRGEDIFCKAWPVSNESQNGLARPQGAHCDIGSFEAEVTMLRVFLPFVEN